MTDTATRRGHRAQRARLRELPARRVHVLRDEHFAHVDWPTGHHVMSVEAFLKALMRDVAWNFFYGIVNFDSRHRHDEPLRERRPVRRPVQRRLPQGRDRPPGELPPRRDHRPPSRPCSPTGRTTGTTRSPPRRRPGRRSVEKRGDNLAAITRRGFTAQRMVGVPGDEPLRSDDTGHPINRMFADVAQDEPVVEAEPGYEDEVAAFNLFAYLVAQRRDVEPVGGVGVPGQPLLPHHRGVHPADHPRQRPRRVVRPALRRDPLEGRGPRHRRPRAKVLMKAGDVAAMPADIRHQGYSPKRAMLLVWENGSPELPGPDRPRRGPKTAVEFCVP